MLFHCRRCNRGILNDLEIFYISLRDRRLNTMYRTWQRIFSLLELVWLWPGGWLRDQFCTEKELRDSDEFPNSGEFSCGRFVCIIFLSQCMIVLFSLSIGTNVREVNGLVKRSVFGGGIYVRNIWQPDRQQNFVLPTNPFLVPFLFGVPVPISILLL